MKKTILVVLFLLPIFAFGQDSKSSSLDSNTCIHGKVYKYFLNGNPKSFKTYTHGFLYGEYAEYYRSGQVKEKGFMDDVNGWTLVFRRLKVDQEYYDKAGEFIKSSKSEIEQINPVPYGKCQCEDGNVKRIRSLLLGTWIKERMIPFGSSDQIIDSVFTRYNTKITFFSNDSLAVSQNGINRVGRYFLTSNTLILDVKDSQNKWETLISMRWPKKTLYPNSTQEHFDLELFELLKVLGEDENIRLSNVIVKFQKET